jgi:hypothetical protein
LGFEGKSGVEVFKVLDASAGGLREWYSIAEIIEVK